jgi:hypothetical protein
MSKSNGIVDHHTETSSAHSKASAERFLVTCPHCKSTLAVRAAYMGSGVRCKRCEKKFLVPGMSGDQPVPIYDGLTDTGSRDVRQAENTFRSTSGDTTYSSLVDELVGFIHAHQKLLIEHQALQEVQDRTHAELVRTSAEGQTLATELSELRDANQLLAIAQAESQRLAAQLEARARDLNSAYEDRHSAVVQLRAEKLELDAVRADSDSMKTLLAEQQAALVRAREDLVELQGQNAKAIASRELAERARNEEVQQIAAKLASTEEQHKHLIETHAGVAKQLAELQGANLELLAAAEQLSSEYKAQVDRERLEREKLSGELTSARREVDEYARKLREAEELAQVASQLMKVASSDAPTAAIAADEELGSFEVIRGTKFVDSEYLSKLIEEAQECGCVRSRISDAPETKAFLPGGQPE